VKRLSRRKMTFHPSVILDTLEMISRDVLSSTWNSEGCWRLTAALPWLTWESLMPTLSRPLMTMLVLAVTWSGAIWAGRVVAIRDAAAARVNLIFILAPFKRFRSGWLGPAIRGEG
jgi:hypothetical protein